MLEIIRHTSVIGIFSKLLDELIKNRAKEREDRLRFLKVECMQQAYNQSIDNMAKSLVRRKIILTLLKRKHSNRNGAKSRYVQSILLLSIQLLSINKFVRYLAEYL